jgi:hypothetical protein
MADRVSNYRVVRLALFMPQTGSGRARWSLVAVGVSRGVPNASILLDGLVPISSGRPPIAEIIEALQAVVDQARLS